MTTALANGTGRAVAPGEKYVGWSGILISGGLGLVGLRAGWS